MSYKLSIASPTRISKIRASRARRLLAIAEIRSAIIPLSGLIGMKVSNKSGGDIGVLVDIVVRWSSEIDYPPLTGIVVRIGRRRAFVNIEEVYVFEKHRVSLNSTRVDLRDFKKRNGEVLLGKDILDHQLVDTEGIQVIRASELYIARALGKFRLVGVEVGTNALLRRLGPRVLRAQANPIKVIDWSDVAAFDESSGTMKLRAARANGGIKRLRPAELADLLEDLDRDERSGLIDALGVETVADALEEMEPEQLEAFIRGTEPEMAADLVANMEPDEAADMLRDLDNKEREQLLDLLEPDVAADLKELISFPEDTAGGIMTSVLVEADENRMIYEVIEELRTLSDHKTDLDGVIVVDGAGIYQGDVSIFDLLVAPDQNMPIGSLLDDSKGIFVDPLDELELIADRLIETRRSSVVVVKENIAIGRILADDLIDSTLSTKHQRIRFPRLLS